MLVAAVFITAPNCKQPKQLPAGAPCSRTLLSKEKEPAMGEPHSFLLSQRRQTQKMASSKIPFIDNILEKTRCFSQEAHQRLPGSRGRVLTARGTKEILGVIKVLHTGRVDNLSAGILKSDYCL